MSYICTVSLTTGEIQAIIKPSSTSHLPDYQEKAGMAYIKVPDTTDTAALAENNVWDAQTKDWVHRPPRPASYATWTATGWSVDMNRFMEEVRKERDLRLRRSDFTQLSDAPVLNKEAWSAYRQALRDLPDNISGVHMIEDIDWPTEPS